MSTQTQKFYKSRSRSSLCAVVTLLAISAWSLADAETRHLLGKSELSTFDNKVIASHLYIDTDSINKTPDGHVEYLLVNTDDRNLTHYDYARSDCASNKLRRLRGKVVENGQPERGWRKSLLSEIWLEEKRMSTNEQTAHHFVCNASQ